MIDQPIYTFTLTDDGTPNAYDEAMAAACLQGLINRDQPRLYILNPNHGQADHWLEVLSADGRWLANRSQIGMDSLDEVREMAGSLVKGAIIWDPSVPASLNAATTAGAIEDCVVLSPEYAERYLDAWGLKVIHDLRGRFTGSLTGSAKNDAYRWAIDKYLVPGHCNPHFLHLYEDSWETRENGEIRYVVTRDWSYQKRAFVFDLSPWGDERPLDDPDQPLGADLATYKIMLEAIYRHQADKQMTELTGFFHFRKYSNDHDKYDWSKHHPVATEWETVRMISPYNGYQNTIASLCFNQSLHSQAPIKTLKQSRPASKPPLEKKTYICVLMADYDSATPFYDALPGRWADPQRGEMPFAWGINPNLMEAYPDLFEYFYDTATPADTFTADASAAGYMNPNFVREDNLPLFIAHNKKFYEACDMTMSPMVLDWSEPTPAVKDAFTQFSPDGYATYLSDFHLPHPEIEQVKPHVWKGMPVMELINSTCNFESPEVTARLIDEAIRARGDKIPGFYFFRIVWTSPGDVIASIEKLKEKYPGRDYEVLDPYNFFRLFKESEGTRD